MAGFRWCVGASVQTKQLGALAFVGKCLAFGGRVVTSFVQSLEAGAFVIGHVMQAIATKKPQQIPVQKRHQLMVGREDTAENLLAHEPKVVLLGASAQSIKAFDTL